MKRLALALAALAAAWGIRCVLRGRHDPRRQFIGGSRCQTCGCPFGDLGTMRPTWRPKDAA